MAAPNPYPQHAKLEEFGNLPNELEEFLAWLGDSENVHLVRYDEAGKPIDVNPVNALVAKYLNIDYDALTAETAAITAEHKLMKSS